MNTSIVGKNIKVARELLGISQKELANKLGMSWEMISRYENGRSNPYARIGEIAYHLSQNVEFFFKSNDTQGKLEVNKIPLFYENRINWNIEYRNYDLVYLVPDWVFNRFEKIFALKLKNIKSSHVQFNNNDIGIFTLKIIPEIKFCLYGDQIFTCELENLKENMAGLIYIEKRFV